MSFIPVSFGNLSPQQSGPWNMVPQNAMNLMSQLQGVQRQGIQNQYLPPELASIVMQQQQRAQQMLASTPYAAQLASNTALSQFPNGLMQLMLTHPKQFLAEFPWLAKELGGAYAGQYGNTAPAPTSATAPQSSATKPVALGQINNPTNSQGNPTPVSQQKTWMGSIFKIPGEVVNFALGGNTNNNNNQNSNTQIPKSNLPTFGWTNTKLPAAQRVSMLQQWAQKEYEAEHGNGSWAKASPAIRKQQIMMSYNAANQAIQHPYGAP